MTDFRVGQKVVCVNPVGWSPCVSGTGLFGEDKSLGPDYGEVCTVRGFQYEGSEVFLEFNEWPFDGTDGPEEYPAYHADYFRPASIVARVLHTVKEELIEI